MSDQTPAEPDYKAILYSLIGSISLADHIGDVADYVHKALKLAGTPWPSDCDDLSDVGAWLGKTYGVKTLYGTELTGD